MDGPSEGPKLGIEISRAYAAFSNGYDYRRSITINESQVTGSGDLTAFPVLISLSDATFRTTGNGGRVTDADGDDIVFATDDQGASPLDFEMERYNATTGEITAWVEVPTLDFDNNTVIYMFYANASVTTSQEDVAGTWDGNYIGVYHMDGDASTQLDSADASVSHDGTVSGATAGVNGKIGPAYDFDGTNDVITISDQAELDVTNSGTFEAWMRTDDTTTWETSFSSFVTVDSPNGWDELDASGMDMVIVGENMYYGSLGCNAAAEIEENASSTLSGSAFRNWVQMATSSAFNFDGCGAGEGGQISLDSDGEHIYYYAVAHDTTTERPYLATSTIAGRFGDQRVHTNQFPGGGGASEHGGIDMVGVGGNLYLIAVEVDGTNETISTTTITKGAVTSPTWHAHLNPTTALTPAANQGCNAAIDSDGYSLFYTAYCHSSTPAGNVAESYASASSTVGSTAQITWVNEADPDGMGVNEIGGIDIAFAGGRIFHAAAFATSSTLGNTETFSTASSSAASGGTLVWTVRAGMNGVGNLDGEVTDVAVETDGKNIYYAVVSDNNSTETFQLASSTLAAHPFMSKRNAYEMIQVGNGYAFDWAGKPYGFGTSTNTTNFKHVVVTQDGTTLDMYEDGVLKRSQTTTADFESNANSLLIGSGHRSVGTQIWFDGIIDEVRVSNTARSADWIQTQYNNQNATSTFYTLGAEIDGSLSSPIVTTNYASNVGASSASLFGNITSTGGETGGSTQHGIAYSTNATLSSGVSTTTLGTYAAAGIFSSSVTGLLADTTYYYRAYATNTTGTGYGGIQSFFTGNSSVTRNLRLFEGSTVKLLNGRVILHQR